MKRIFLTVDTECHDIDKINQYIYGETKDGASGLRCILEIGKKHNIPINFFLDIPEYNKYGEEYLNKIIELIHSYNQPVYFHFHPNYVHDDSRTYLWEYSDEEQKDLLYEGLKEYKHFCKNVGPLVFRAGRYGVNPSTYSILNELGTQVYDFSYCANRPKMCHISAKETKTFNKPTRYKGVILHPNTSYVGLDYLGKKTNILLGVTDTTINEFSRIIKGTSLKSMTYCMHSWSLMDKWFFLNKYVGRNRFAIKRMEKCIEIAKSAGFVFSDIKDFELDQNVEDEMQNMCSDLKGKLLGIGNNFLRFQRMAKLNKKYFLIYSAFYLFVIVFATFVIFRLFLG